MSDIRAYKHTLSAVSRLWKQRDYDGAMAEVASAFEVWPGNAHLHVLWASLVQLQEDPAHDLDEAKEALKEAVQLDQGSPAAAIELGHFLDNVEDDPQGASRAYADGIATARRLLIDGLIAQAKALKQLNRRREFLRCLEELLLLARFENGSKRPKAGEAEIDLIVDSSAGYLHIIHRKGPYAERIQDLLSDAVSERPA